MHLTDKVEAGDARAGWRKSRISARNLVGRVCGCFRFACTADAVSVHRVEVGDVRTSRADGAIGTRLQVDRICERAYNTVAVRIHSIGAW